MLNVPVASLSAEKNSVPLVFAVRLGSAGRLLLGAGDDERW